MSAASRINVNQARNDVQVSDALLVCAYKSEEKCAANHLESALPLSEFQQREDQISKDREVIFYCA